MLDFHCLVPHWPRSASAGGLYLGRSWLWDLFVIGYLWFMAFNAAVVFESGMIRWLGLLATLVMAATGFRALVATKRVR